ncbi:hypothetical protein GPALN_006573 [Globodera pallida]|nr:hypothetical protein GPALN_006573 [Globodera pallida]
MGGRDDGSSKEQWMCPICSGQLQESTLGMDKGVSDVPIIVEQGCSGSSEIRCFSQSEIRIPVFSPIRNPIREILGNPIRNPYPTFFPIRCNPVVETTVGADAPELAKSLS